MTGGFIFGGGVPDEVKEAIEHAEMQAEADNLTIRGILDKCDYDELRALRDLFSRMGSAQGVYYTGVMSGILTERHGACIGCQQIHSDTEELETHANGGQPSESSSAPAPVADEDGTLKSADPFDFTEEQYDKLCGEYGVNPIEEDKELQFQKMRVKCGGCGLLYGNLADRMLRPAGVSGCSGCAQKAKFG